MEHRISNLKTHLRKQQSATILLSELIRLHEAHQKPNTIGVNHALLFQLTAFYGRIPALSTVTDEFCRRFACFLLKRLKINSAKTYLQKMHAVLQYAVLLHLVDQNPMPAVNTLIPRHTTPQRMFLSMQEFVALRNTPCRHPETKRAFLFACVTGLRLSDIETLCWDDIQTNGNAITIVKTQVKTGGEVRIPLNDMAKKLIGEKRKDGRVFHLPSRSMIANDLRRWAIDANINKHITFHVSRHTFATQSIASGVSIYVVSKLCGHTSVKTTEIYAHMLDSTLQQGVEKLNQTLNMNAQSNTKHAAKSWLHRLFRCFRGQAKIVDKKCIKHNKISIFNHLQLP